jgi:hypothetical protein
MMKGAEMLDTKGFLTVKQYSDYRKVSRQTVYKHIRNGKLTDSVYTVDNQTMIDQVEADRELSQNLDQIHNPGRQQPDQTARLKIQGQAMDIAGEGEEPGPGGYTYPWPIWAARYAGALFNLDPDRVSVEQIDKRHWRLSIDEVDTEDGTPAPWTVDLFFDFNRHPDPAP